MSKIGEMIYERANASFVVAIHPSAARVRIPAADRHGRDADAMQVIDKRALPRRVYQDEGVAPAVRIPGKVMSVVRISRKVENQRIVTALQRAPEDGR